jgi:hypothetical protein
MRLLKLSLYLGSLFNLSMGCIFLSNRLLEWFLLSAKDIEKNIFGKEVLLTFPSDPLHQLLIHGFGAGVVILGATLLYSAKDPGRFRPFIFFDGAGRLLFSLLMFYYVLTFSLARTILIFGMVEFLFALIYIWGSLSLSKWPVSSN